MKTVRRPFRRPSTRRLAQLYAALLYNAHLRGFVSGGIYTGPAKYACVPGLNCYSCPGAVGSCPLGALQNALGASGHRAGWYILGILTLFGVILGRTICGWLCPMGLLQELLHKVPTLKIRKSRITRVLSRLKYAVLAVFVLAVPLWYGLRYDTPLPAFCKYICPAGTLEGAIGLLFHPANADLFAALKLLFTSKFIIMLVIGLACVFCFRSFCRFLCPLGAVLGLFSRFNLIGVKVDAGSCIHCGSCVRSCAMDVRRVGDSECIQCGKCMEVCSQRAISVRAGQVVLTVPAEGCPDDAPEAPGRRRRLAAVIRGAALAVLCFALLWFNFLDPSLKAEGSSAAAVSTQSDAPVGSAVGQQLEDFTVTCFDGSEFHLADFRGKPVFLNLWATWCGPCVGELPYFDELYAAHGDDIAMLAVHSSLVTDDPAGKAEAEGWSMPLALDEDDEIFRIVNGSNTLPQTIVLNRRGEVVYNEVRSVTPDMLEALYELASR